MERTHYTLMDKDTGQNTPKTAVSKPKVEVSDRNTDSLPISPKTAANGADLADAEQSPRVTCALCLRGFSSKGTLGRHLDRKKGDREHPADAVEHMRGPVRRRAPNSAVSAAAAPSRTPEARRQAARKYNSQQAVRDRNRQRRRARDLGIRAQLDANRWYVGEILGRCSHTSVLPVDPDFPYLVASMVPPGLWPSLGASPGDDELKHAVKVLSATAYSGSVSLQMLLDEYTAWEALEAGEKLGAWQRGQDRALRELGASLWEVRKAGEMISKKQTEIYEGYSVDQFYGVDSEEE